MSDRCESCRFWLKGILSADDNYGWCKNVVINNNPGQIDGYYYEGNGGLETYSGATCNQFERFDPKKKNWPD